MADRKKLICQNPNHPFKQKWYWYTPADKGEYSNVPHLHSEQYCVSCASYLNLLKTLLTVALMPSPTLYGDATIKTSKEQLKELVDTL
jgi:hypothetical protein